MCVRAYMRACERVSVRASVCVFVFIKLIMFEHDLFKSVERVKLFSFIYGHNLCYGLS